MITLLYFILNIQTFKFWFPWAKKRGWISTRDSFFNYHVDARIQVDSNSMISVYNFTDVAADDVKKNIM
jgi:hypothetical protein